MTTRLTTLKDPYVPLDLNSCSVFIMLKITEILRLKAQIAQILLKITLFSVSETIFKY